MEIKNVKVYGMDESIIRSGYPMQVGEPLDHKDDIVTVIDKARAVKLAKVPSGSGHDNFLKGIIVQFDLRYPEYFSPQLQRYNWIDIVSSQSKMHKITSRKLDKNDFTGLVYASTIQNINDSISLYSVLGDKDAKQVVFQEIISNLPSGYLKWMGISTNYLQLKTIYNQRKTHKLDEWRYFCNWIKSLPMSEFITSGETK